MTPQQIMAAAFNDELEKIASKPRYIRNLIEGGKRTRQAGTRIFDVGDYIRGVRGKQEAGRSTGRYLKIGWTRSAMESSRRAGKASGKAQTAFRLLKKTVPQSIKGPGRLTPSGDPGFPGGSSRIRGYKRRKLRTAKKNLSQSRRLMGFDD